MLCDVHLFIRTFENGRAKDEKKRGIDSRFDDVKFDIDAVQHHNGSHKSQKVYEDHKVPLEAGGIFRRVFATHAAQVERLGQSAQRKRLVRSAIPMSVRIQVDRHGTVGVPRKIGWLAKGQ